MGSPGHIGKAKPILSLRKRCFWGRKLIKTRLLLRLALKKKHSEKRGGKPAVNPWRVQNPDGI